MEAFTPLGIDPELPQAEQLLEAIGLLDRLRRTELPAPLTGKPAAAPEELKGTTTLSPKAARALELALGPTYQAALREFLLRIKTKKAVVPAHLAVELLESAMTLHRIGKPHVAGQFFELTGNRGAWLAAQHPEWKQLLPPADFAADYAKLVMPSDQVALLRRWRQVDPDAARLALITNWKDKAPKQQQALLAALRTNLSEADIPFLQSCLPPRRKEVRRLATRLLLLLEEPNLKALFLEMAGSWLSGDSGTLLSADPDHLPLLEDHGFYDKKIDPEASLIANLPPTYWKALTGRSPLDVVNRLLSIKKRWLPQWLDAVVFYDDPVFRLASSQYLLQLNVPQSELTKLTYEFYDQLSAEEYASLCNWGQKNVEQVYRNGSVLRQISLQLYHPWPDALCKSIITDFTTQLNSRRAYYGFVPNTAWKLLPYRIDVALFPWLRQQLYAATDRSDQLGSVATKILQVVSFRKAALEAFQE